MWWQSDTFLSYNHQCFHVQIKFNMAPEIFQWLPLIFNDFSRQNAIFPGQHKIPWLFKSRVKFHDFSRPIRTMHSSETWTQYVVQPTQCINQLLSWYGTTFRKKSRKLFRGRDLILMKLKPHVSLAGSSTNSPFPVSTRGPKIAQAWQKSIGVKTLTIWVCVPNLRPLYNF